MYDTVLLSYYLRTGTAGWEGLYEGNSKSKVTYFYLNKITYKETHEAEIQSHISFTPPHSHQVCLDTYHSDIPICQVLHRKKLCPGHVTISWLHFEHLYWSGSADLWGASSSLGRDASPTVPNQDSMVDVEEFLNPRSSRNSRLRQHWGRALSCERRTPSPLVNNPGLLRRIASLSLFRTHFFFCPLFQYGRHLETTAVSVHVTWGGDYYCYLVVNICTNRTNACQLNARIPSAEIKWGTLLFELPS
jgi:hypothetical protein